MSFFVSDSLKDNFSFQDILKNSEPSDSIYEENEEINYPNYPLLLTYDDVDLEILEIDEKDNSFILHLDKSDYKLFASNVKKENKASITIFDDHFKSLIILQKNIKNYEYVSNSLIKVCIVIDID